MIDPGQPDLTALLRDMAPEQIARMVEDLPPGVVNSLLTETASWQPPLVKPRSPLAQAVELDEGYRDRPHLRYMSNQVAQAVEDMDSGKNRLISISMPPRSGKSHLGSIYTPIWLLRHDPRLKIALISHDPSLATLWGRSVRNTIEQHVDALGLTIARDAGAAAEWQTTEGGGILSRSAPGQSITGRGFNVMILDDLVKDFATAHSETHRDALWAWWLNNALTRLQPPYIVIVIGTRWHEDDFIGRLLSPEHEGDPAEWEVISFPAIAEEHDALGREPGEPLISPLLDETPQEALDRWNGVKRISGTYAWNALYQQRPSDAKGAIFNSDWWRYWTTDPAKVSRDAEGNIDPDGKIVLLDPEKDLGSGARWLDSWDCAFKGTDDSDYVVGQRWAMKGPRRYLIDQSRARRSFTTTLAEMRRWAGKDADGQPHPLTPRYTQFVHERVVEDKANGTAVIDVLKEQVDGLIPVNPTNSKEARARSVTPTVEAGNVFLPLPSDPGNEWVIDLVDEFKQFPTGRNDDQVDALSQALTRLRQPGQSSINNPNALGSLGRVRRGQVALQDLRVRRAGAR